MIYYLENVTVIGEELALLFSGGNEIYLDVSLLRKSCPCAVCQGEPDAMGRVLRPSVKYGLSSFDLVNYQVVGGYALQLFWGDGHSTGIYSYDYLQKLAKSLRE
jgi:DUF971 family protein